MLKEVFSRLRRASLTFDLAKCEFGKAVVTYLGKVVGQGEVRTLSAKVQAIFDFPQPKKQAAAPQVSGHVWLRLWFL